MLSFKGKNKFETDKLNLFSLASQGEFESVQRMLSRNPILATCQDPFNSQYNLLDHVILNSKSNIASIKLMMPYLGKHTAINEVSLHYLVRNNQFKMLNILLKDNIIDPNHIYPSGICLLDAFNQAIATSAAGIKWKLEKTKNYLSADYHLLTAEDVKENIVLDKLAKRVEGLVLDLIDPDLIPDVKPKKSPELFQNSSNPSVKSQLSLSKSAGISARFGHTSTASACSLTQADGMNNVPKGRRSQLIQSY
ncbi:MAG: hypothetical protein HYX61_00045 [Gammaproteobacteria bacterium]|nr:hypothetical protein [Gammaproteobacteria bacterium]